MNNIKNIILITVAVTLFASCEKVNTNNTSTPIKNNTLDLSLFETKIQSSDDYISLINNLKYLPNQGNSRSDSISLFLNNEVNWSSPLLQTNADGSYIVLYNVYSGDGSLKGNLVSVNANGLTRTFYESFNELDVTVGGNINLYYKNMESKFTMKISVVEGKFLEGDVDVPIGVAQTWWGCTTDCYKTAKDACDGNGECKFLCDMLGNICVVEIFVACGVNCI